MDFLIYWLISLLCWHFAIICSSCSDIVTHSPTDNIFTKIFKDGPLHKYFCLDENWWRRKYIDGEIEKGRKKFYGIVIPALFFDAWHGFKVLRQYMYYNSVFFSGMVFAVYYGTTIVWIVVLYTFSLVVFMVLTHLTHKLWYEKLLRGFK